jgi:DNA-binding LacI/PurR family transcriptional regulator/DNA-binding transcriptional regulator YhcF (GntR family)
VASPLTTHPSGSDSKSALAAALLTRLRERILSGEYPAGAWLPTERELADEFRVDRRAVHRAIARLAEEGLVQCRPRFRPVVTGPSETSTLPPLSPGTTPAIARLVALVMWHGDPNEQEATAQQRIFWGLNHRLAHDGYHGIFLDLGEAVGTELENAEREAVHLRYALEQNFAGVIFYAYAYRRNRELIQEIAHKMPLVLIDRLIPGIEADYVGVDNYGAMYETTRHLLSQGHRRILFVTTSEPINTVQDRLAGYREALADMPGGPAAEHILIEPADWNAPELPSFDSLFHLPEGQRPTAIVCINDHIALCVCRRLIRLGLRVPEDVALSGFDDIIPQLPNHVGLTTVAQPFEQIGSAAAEAFLARHDGTLPMPLRHTELPARLIIRQSTTGSGSGFPSIFNPKTDQNTSLAQSVS